MKFLATLIFTTFLASSAIAQDSFFDINADFAAGWGSSMGEESETFSQESQYVIGQANLLNVDLFDTTSGVGVEVMFGGEVQYTVWSLNRATVPGTNDRAYAGSDMKILQSTDQGGAEGNFDLRLVTGYRLANIGPGQLRVELYFIEENKPIAFGLLYGF